MNRSVLKAALVLFLGMTLTVVGACASGEIANVSGEDGESDTESDTTDTAGADALADAGGQDATDADDDGEASDTTSDADMGDDSGDASIDIAYDVCILNDAGPWDDCAASGGLNFGPVGDGESVTRFARIDNIGDEAFDIVAAQVASSNFDVVVTTYSDDDPPQATEQTLPFTLAASESVFFEVTVTGIPTSGSLGADHLVVSMEQSGTPAPDEEIQLVGGFTGCVGQTADCDGDASNGCEVDLSSDTNNCGQCGTICSDVNATATCDGGDCVVSCDAGFGNCDSDATTGCEQELSSIPNCGSCGEDCALPNADSTCEQSACQFQTCDPGYEDCDNDLQANGCEIHTDVNPSNCGACGSICNVPFASEECSGGQCNFLGCDPDRHDLNQDLSDGCEYACTFTSSSDPPDLNGTDANCDGIDGEVIRAIFVAKSGDDSNAGSPDAPVLTLAEALSTAATTSGIDHVYVSRGVYEEQVTLENGISIYGGYAADQNWNRSNTYVTKIYNPGTPGQPPIAVEGDGLSNRTVVDLLTIESGSASGDGVSSYGLHCDGCTGLELTNNTIIGGNGSPGINGSDGQSGQNAYGRGYNGGYGGTGSCDGSGWGAGGAAGTSDCGRRGGAGGRGGSEGSNSGYTGQTGLYSSPAGAGGGSESDGGDGASGTDGASGGNGSGGSSASVSGGFWVAEDGLDGNDGNHGNGGSGGGGGGGQGGFWVNDGSGNGGGGGGGGGCGGLAGAGGHAGGGSFGLFLIDSSGVVIDNSEIISGNGGDGGDGGSGGVGSSGGLGRPGGSYCSGEVGDGGAGGHGGDGGNGGHGGGGRGGDSVSVFTENTTVTLPGTNTLLVGSAGSGGASSGSAGAHGQARTK